MVIKVKIHSKVLERFASHSSNHVSGCLYGLAPSPSNKDDPYLVWSATGRDRQESEDGGRPERKNLEVLPEILPCGLDPLGVFVLNKKATAVDEQAVQSLVEQLPEAFLEIVDPLVLTQSGSELRCFVSMEGSLEEVDFVSVAEGELAKEVQAIRVKGRLTLVSLQTEVDLQSAFKHLNEKISCPYGTFRLCHSDVFFLHTWETRRRVAGSTYPAGSHGWAGASVIDEDEEQCMMTNVDDSADIVQDLWRFIKSPEEEEEDDGFGVKGTARDKKKVEEKDVMTFQLLMKMSGEACTSKTLNCAPVVHYEKREHKNIVLKLSLDALGVVRKTTKIPDLMEVLKGCLQRQVHEMGRSVLSELKMRGTTSMPEVFHLKPDQLGHLCSVIYNRRGSCANFAEYRRHLHRLFLLPVDRPVFRRMNKFVFDEDKINKGPLTNVHQGVKPGGVVGELHLVKGTYSYHHYLQDGFNDDGWGCAYRSLQTIISWFRHQGYTGTEIPTHAQVQKCLVELGDKESSFEGSKQWIGSTEVGLVLEKAVGVQSRFVSVSSGDDMPTKARDLANHFDTHGTPVMIGGGVLAHTILGVDWNEATGGVRWLILDPHYTGPDWTQQGSKKNVEVMQQKGWVGWKGPDFWVKGAFYNMCMPQRPVQW